jgi:hypothetical protein
LLSKGSTLKELSAISNKASCAALNKAAPSGADVPLSGSNKATLTGRPGAGGVFWGSDCGAATGGKGSCETFGGAGAGTAIGGLTGLAGSGWGATCEQAPTTSPRAKAQKSEKRKRGINNAGRRKRGLPFQEDSGRPA